MAWEQFAMSQVHLDEMIQICMLVPMASQPLAWKSRELAALTAYMAEVQKRFAAANPCAARNPCAAKKPR